MWLVLRYNTRMTDTPTPPKTPRRKAAPAPAPTALETAFHPGRIATAAVIVVAILGVAWLAVTLTRFFMLVFASIVLAAVFDAIASALTRFKWISRPIALILAVLGMIGLFAFVFMLFGSQLAGEFVTIKAMVPEALRNLEGFLHRYGMGDSVRDLVKLGSDDISRLAQQAGGYALAAGSGLTDFLLVLVGAIFLAGDPDTYRRGLLLVMPPRAEPVADIALGDASRGLRGWMMGQAVSSLVIAALTWGGLALLGVPASGGLGLIAGLLDIIPMIGPVIAGAPAVLLAFTVSPATALWTLVLFLVIQQLQGNFLQPMIQKRAVDVPPGVLLFAVVACGLLFGFLGVLLAGPLTVVIYVLVQRIYVQAILGKAVKVGGQKDPT